MNSFTSPAMWVHLDWVLLVVLGWLLISAAGVLALRRLRFVAIVLFPAGALLSLLLMAVALSAMFAGAQTAVLPLGLPQLPFHLRLDSLASFFLLLIGGVSAGVSAFAAGYFRKGEGTPPGLICLEYHVFLASIALLVLADDAYMFMVMWETMALSSFFLVLANHRHAPIRQAGYLYLLVAHVGALGILLCFGLLQAGTGDYTFANMRQQNLTPFWGSVAFILAVFGFGAKAGLLPLHAWLPEAHPAAPSPFSALMSGVMLKIALYGILRVAFDLLQTRLWWWGVLLMGLGLATALFGVVFSTVQVEMKRLLAYSSIENIGLMCAGIGLSLLFSAYSMHAFAALALTAALYHMISHAFFKSLLFCSTGAVLHATGERSLGKLGGLMRYMPWVAWPTLVGALACAGLPPFGGFVAEWLLLQSFLFTTGLPNTSLDMLVPVMAALIALIAALSGFTMVKYLWCDFSRAAARGKTRAGARRRSLGAPGHVVAGDRLRVAGPVTQPHDCADRPGDAHAGAWRTGAHRGRKRLAAGASECRARQLCPGDLLAGHRVELRSVVLAGAQALPRPLAPGAAVGLRPPLANRTHAGYGRGFWPPDPAYFFAVFPHEQTPAERF
jgi:hydrogenase-4 component B